MGFLHRARLVLKGDLGSRLIAARLGQQQDEMAGAQLVALEELAARMASMAASIRELEERAQKLTAEAASGGSAEGAKVQVEIIDELLGGVRQFRAALDEQRRELEEAERRLTAGGGTFPEPSPRAQI